MNAPTGRRVRVAVVFGGRSSEHAISCVTAGSVLQAIDREKYDVVPIGITRDGRWVQEIDDPTRHRITGPGQLPSVDETLPSADREFDDVDVVFPLLHGPWGEDGTIQGLLEMSDVRYVGSGVLASAVCMDKAFMKVALQAAGLPVTPGTTTTATEWADQEIAVHSRCDQLGYPLFVKPARGGSSIGIAKAHGPADLAAAIEGALAHDPKILIEVSAEGAREIECGVLDDLDGSVEVSVPAEIRITGDHEFYDFEAKYLPEEATELDVPAVLDEQTRLRMQDLAAAAFRAAGCEGLARVDFFLMPDGSLVINELNTMPGFTPLSMFPQMWAASGMPYSELVDRLLTLALQRPTGLR
ncbi:D-alanine--D-alanine ligase [Nocardioides sp. Root190]|uniref:D-alanine--D-alanine ligase family protein n=1 Tax=Nocardioides sp. Root190 TaxID=1736488 RepID=UPI0006F80E1A|nr:D-alanine--D-alanine ligase family protein [Nocardioides sp. Root190]KRB77235.1 D-alanine--D-alanine ligase [Nocardioides sp. Root190]